MEVSFKSRKLRNSINRISNKAKSLDLDLDSLLVYGVTRDNGVTVTGKAVGSNLGEYYYFSGQKIAYNPYRANIGSIGITHPDFVGLISPAYVVFEVDETIYPEFLFLYLKSSIGQGLIKWYGDRGGVRSSLRISDLGKIDFPDISYEEQKKFYAEFSEKKIEIDKLLNELNSQQEFISQLRQSMLQDAVKGKLTENWRKENLNGNSAGKIFDQIKVEEAGQTNGKRTKNEKPALPFGENDIKFGIPDEWEWVRLQSLIKDLRYGTSKKCDYGLGKTMVLRIPNIQKGKIDLTDLKSTNLSKKELEDLGLQKNDILIIRSNGSESLVGRTAVVEQIDRNFSFAGYLMRLRPIDNFVISDYLHIVFESRHIRSQIEGPIKDVSGVKNINSTKVNNLLIPFPHYSEQVKIVEKVNQLTLLYDILEKEVVNNIANAEKMLHSTLQKLLGKESPTFFIEVGEKNSSAALRVVKYNSKTTDMELIDLLEKHGKLHAEDLWKMSKHYDSKNVGDSIDKFYADLKDKIEVDAAIKEVVDEKGYLELI